MSAGSALNRAATITCPRGALRSSPVRAGRITVQHIAGYERQRRHSCAPIEDGARLPGLLVDRGTADGFLESQLKPELREAPCAKAGIPLTIRRQEGYDHSYFFISTFVQDRLRWHARALAAAAS